jgi:hypothetical protein
MKYVHTLQRFRHEYQVVNTDIELCKLVGHHTLLVIEHVKGYNNQVEKDVKASNFSLYVKDAYVARLHEVCVTARHSCDEEGKKRRDLKERQFKSLSNKFPKAEDWMCIQLEELRDQIATAGGVTYSDKFGCRTFCQALFIDDV